MAKKIILKENELNELIELYNSDIRIKKIRKKKKKYRMN